MVTATLWETGPIESPIIFQLLGDGASWSTVVEEGEPVDTTGTGETTSSIGEMTLGAGRSTLGGGESFHEVRVLNCCVQKPLQSVHQNRHELSQ
ncbi:hypothetical protein Tco_0678840 [Tanacetum coccineum]|uniref:Uncharacterized protein n=1 Tax=Tanacetum coccineum TaxID=301880 RepID=A0ABQ4XHH4_9ASTR